MILLPILAAAAAIAPSTERVACSFDDGPPIVCRMADIARADGSHRMTFSGAGRRVTFEGRPQTGWWSGRLNGAAAMGYERNRGNIVFATADLRTTFAWWYPADAHGRY